MLQLFSSGPEPMSSCSNSIDGVAAVDFNLPDEILSVIPTDPYDQLDLARKITSMAIAARVSRLESEAGHLQQKLTEKERTVFELQERLTHLEDALQQSDARLRDAIDENTTLTSERDALAAANKKLQRDLAKLETFKRQLMQSLKDESSPTEAIDIRTCDHPIAQVSSLNDEGSNGYIKPNISHGFTGVSVYDASRHHGRWLSLSPYIKSQATSPNVISTAITPGRCSNLGSPKRASGAGSPTRPQFEARTSLSSWYPSSQQSSAASSPPRGPPIPNRNASRTPRIDGKEFFRQARNCLSYEQFSAFLANIKELNARKQSREETLKRAEEIFGIDNKDLYLSFQGLLNRNVS